MSLNYTLADMLTRIRNGQQGRLKEVRCRRSKFCAIVLRILQEEGFISNFQYSSEREIIVELKYKDNKPLMEHISCVSRPGKRIYASVRSLWEIKPHMGIFILSTPKGLMTNKTAKEKNVGGEVLCLII